MIKVNSKVIIKSNLCDELEILEFDKYDIASMRELIGTTQKVFAIWEDEDSKQKYATIDLCMEIPLQCLEELQSNKKRNK